MKNISIILSLLFLFASVAFSQDMGADAQRAEMKKLDSGVGKWEGTGWIQRGPDKMYFQGIEIIQKKLDGLALLVEGRFTDKAKPDMIIHQTLAVLNYDTKEKTYKFKTYLANGASGMHNAKLIEGGWEWGFDIPGGSGTVRYTIKFTADTWFEIGEFSRDGGKTWVKNFEMTLKKVG
jgi:hypothetical protein